MLTATARLVSLSPGPWTLTALGKQRILSGVFGGDLKVALYNNSQEVTNPGYTRTTTSFTTNNGNDYHFAKSPTWTCEKTSMYITRARIYAGTEVIFDCTLGRYCITPGNTITLDSSKPVFTIT